MTQGLEESLTWQGRPILGAKEAAKKAEKSDNFTPPHPPTNLLKPKLWEVEQI